MAAGSGSAAVLRGATGARESADRLVARLQSQLAAATRQRKDTEEALLVIGGDGEVAARVRCFLPALAALVEGRAPTWPQRAQLEGADAQALRAAQRGPRLGAAAEGSPAPARKGCGPVAESGAQAFGHGLAAGWSLAARQGGLAGVAWAPGHWQDPQQPGLLLEALGVELQPCSQVVGDERGASEATFEEGFWVEAFSDLIGEASEPVAAVPPTVCDAIVEGTVPVAAELPTECVAFMGGESDVVEAVAGLDSSVQSAAEVDGEGSCGPESSEAGHIAEPLGASEVDDMLRMLDECAAAVLEGGAGAMVSADVTGGTADTPRAAVEASFADARAAGGVEAGGGAGGKGQGGQRQPPPHDKTVDLKAAAAAAYSKLSKDDPLRQHYEALWPELAAAKPPADQPVVGFKAVEAAARRLDKLQKKVRSAGEQVESAQQYLAESERKLREAMEASIAAEDEFDKLKATVGKQEAPAEPAAEKPTLAALLEQFEHEPDDFHKWSEPDKEVWRAAKAKGERMAQTVKEHEEETAKHLRLLEEETARHQEQLRQLEQVPPHALRQQGQPPRLRPPAPQQLPNQKQAQQNMTKQKNAEPEWRPTSRRRERRSRRLGALRQSSTQKGKVTTQQGSRPKASAKKARRPYHIDFFNVTTWGPQAQGYLMEINNTKDRDIIGIAEHHLRQPAQISKARAAPRRNGTHSYWTKARPGEGEGTRGGTCAITRGSLDIQDRIAGFDEHYLHEDGSDVTVVISNLHKVRFAVAFVYLECGTGFGERNVDILCDLREKMAVWGGPWAALGGFNMTPPELNNSIWPRVLNAQVAAAEDGAPTCFPAVGEARCIDFALISQGLAPYFDQLELLRTAPWKPHIGIRLKLKGRPLMLKGRVLRRPAAIKPPVTVERMPKSRAACRRAARGGQEAMRRRQQALAEAGCDLDENDMEPVPQLYYDKEVKHVIPDELWQATSERVSARAYDELPQHLQHTVVGKMMEREMLDLGQQHDRFASTLELSLCESIGIPEEERGRHLGRSRPPSYKSASIKDTVTSTPWAGVERKIHAWWA
ncbi:unnamed protein product [Prorocentrum cordatum]|uniref:Endonuclease/exonuclease/phosphatase domain-containing protein n=1 Tax=Prorocentrum cordatum TaxID=2364126 RepID=A0ABN9VDI9_9DINO|nr:unnamed protein product [Polarella glacialis]